MTIMNDVYFCRKKKNKKRDHFWKENDYFLRETSKNTCILNFIIKRTDNVAAIVAHPSKRIIIFQLVFHLQWVQFSQHSEAISFYHGHSNPIGRAVEIPHISIYMSSLHPTPLAGEPWKTYHVSPQKIPKARFPK